MLGIVGDERDVQEDDPGLEREVDDLQNLDTSSALAGPAGIAAMAAAERPASAPLAMSRRPKVAASESAEALTTCAPERAEALTEEALWTRRPWKAEARAVLEVAVALEGAATRRPRRRRSRWRPSLFKEKVGTVCVCGRRARGRSSPGFADRGILDSFALKSRPENLGEFYSGETTVYDSRLGKR